MMTTTGDDKAQGTVQIVRFATSDAADGASQQTDASKSAIDVGDSGVLEEAAQVTAALRAANEKIVAGVDDDNHIVTDSFVRVSWAAPGVPNLTLVDLPGFVNTTGDGESQTLSADVEALLKRYMAQERTVMLCIVPANVDYHNSLALKLAGEYDAAGERTVTVVTKPDLCNEGAESDAIRLVNNEVKHLKLGWSCVKARSQQQLTRGATLAASELDEKRFFANNEHWRALDKSLVGIGALRTKLSDILERQTERTLPDVLREIELRKDAAAVSLAALGVAWDSPSVRRRVFGAAINRITSTFTWGLSGAYANDLSFFSDKKHRYRAALHEQEVVLRDAVYGVRVGDDDSEEYEYTPDDEAAQEESKSEDEVSETMKKIQQMIKDNRGEQIPGFLSYGIFKTLVYEKLSALDAPMAEYLEQVESKLTELVQDAIKHAFSGHGKHVCAKLTQIARDVMKERFAAMRVSASDLLEAEKTTPYTLNHYYADQLERIKTQPLLKHIDAIPEAGRGNDHLHITKDMLKAMLSTHGIGVTMNEEWEANELKQRLKAYVTVAGKRIMDDLPMRIDHAFARPLRDLLQNEWAALGDTDEKLALLMTEGKARQSKRQALQKELATMTAAQAASKAFMLGN